MNATIRDQLLEQHCRLRARIHKLLAAATDDTASELAFRVALGEISDELARHNRHEERLLTSLDQHHTLEHAAQLSALRNIVDGNCADAFERAKRNLCDLLIHMDTEEQEMPHE